MDGTPKMEKQETPRERKSQSDHAPSVQVYWRDWSSDAGYQSLSHDLKGRYFDWWLMTHGTKTPGVIGEDALRRAMRLSTAQWARHREAIAACFKIRRDGTWVQERTVREWKAQRKRFVAARASGKKGARKRWPKKKLDRAPMPDPIAPRVATPVATPMAEVWPSPLLLPGDSSPSMPSTERSTRHGPPRVETGVLLEPRASDRAEPDVGQLVGWMAGRMAMEPDA